VDERVFTEFDLLGIKDLPNELGTFNIESLLVRYNFSFDEVVAAINRLPYSVELPGPLKTLVHEITHLFHSITTPFGFLIYALRRLQSHLIINTINDLRVRHQLKIQYPLIDLVLQLPHEIKNDVIPYITAWYEIELFILFMLDYFSAWEKQVLKNPFLNEKTHLLLFLKIQIYLAINYREEARKSFIANNSDKIKETTPLPFDKFEPDHFDPEEFEKAGKNIIFDSVLSNNANMIFITEGAATISEYWGNRNFFFSDDIWKQFYEQFAKKEWSISIQAYLNMIRGSIRTKSLKEFVLTYLTLCELALFGPVLPHHRHFRERRNDPYELFPFMRWRRFLGVLSDVRPMTSLEDYNRFTGEICSALGWVPPWEITRFSASEHVPMHNDSQELIYINACKYRMEYPWIFEDYSFLLKGTNEFHDVFIQNFNFPIIQYSDRTVYHKDKMFVLESVIWYLIRFALRAILLRNHISLRMPYRPKDQSEVSLLQELLLMGLEFYIGIRIKDLTLV
jgi:hypothetical protein